MKPFDVEAAKRGEPICDRDGMPARLIAYLSDAKKGSELVVLYSDGTVSAINQGGFSLSPDCPMSRDLFMGPVKKIRWVNFYNAGGAHWFDKKRVADGFALDGRLGGRAYPVEIEE